MYLLKYLIDNINYFIITCITLFLWDLIDLYIDLKNFHFLRRSAFLTYYVVIAFFSIATMEMGFILGLFEIESKSVIAFVVPLVFAVILENLVVKIGGIEKSIDFSEFFDKFKFAIRDSIIRRDEMIKVQTQTRLLNSKVKNEKILEWCRFYSTDDEMNALIKKTEKMEPRTKRIEIIKHLIRKAKTTDIADVLRKEESMQKMETK